MAQAVRLLLPDAEVSFRNIHGLRHRRAGTEALIAEHREADAIFATSPSLGPSLLPDTPDGPAARPDGDARLLFIPNIFFPAFHPDLIYVGDVTGPPSGHIESPIGPYNSALALYGFRSGYSPDETSRLFTGDVYRRVGYLDAWSGAAEGLLWLAREVGWDLAPDLARWSRRGAFMHSANHPRMFVAADLARGLLRRAGIPFRDFDIDPFLHDELLAQGSWPVYPEIGQLYGISGGTTFLPRSRRSQRQPAPMTLRRFLEGSFALYGRRSRRDLANPRVEGWLADATLAADLRSGITR